MMFIFTAGSGWAGRGRAGQGLARQGIIQMKGGNI